MAVLASVVTTEGDGLVAALSLPAGGVAVPGAEDVDVVPSVAGVPTADDVVSVVVAGSVLAVPSEVVGAVVVSVVVVVVPVVALVLPPVPVDVVVVVVVGATSEVEAVEKPVVAAVSPVGVLVSAVEVLVSVVEVAVVVPVAVGETVGLETAARVRTACDAGRAAGCAGGALDELVAGVADGGGAAALAAALEGALAPAGVVTTAGAPDDPAALDGAGLCAGIAGAAAAGGTDAITCSGPPTVSVTTGAFANGSFAFGGVFPEVDAAVGATCVCVSETTGIRRRTCLRTDGPVTVFRAVTGVARGSGGRGASRCSFGTRSNGKPTAGNDSEGSGEALLVRREDWRNARATGPEYQTASSTMPRHAHQ